ncbi:RNA-directed DNA polymerase, eukaryota [Tanacetum coccineum]|uniref:RNA-directed DNA polymerase, eukaryota n=1 Tax=Tanacetum coccineum TaxID=301880 RepID=A0ABQ5IK56_9ASTR
MSGGRGGYDHDGGVGFGGNCGDDSVAVNGVRLMVRSGGGDSLVRGGYAESDGKWERRRNFMEREGVALKLSHDDLLCSFRRAPRAGAGAEELQYIQLVKIMEEITIFDSNDKWRWSLEGCGEFTVASVRNLLDANSLPVVSSKTRWIKVVPIKVNIHAWKVKLDILPTRLNISKRGMDIESILCPLCEKNVESSSHIFFTCPISREIFRKVLLWWEIDVVMVSSYDEWLEWLLSIRLHSKHKELFEGVCYVLWWYIWNFRNKSIFGSACPSKALIFEEDHRRTFLKGSPVRLPEDMPKQHTGYSFSRIHGIVSLRFRLTPDKSISTRMTDGLHRGTPGDDIRVTPAGISGSADGFIADGGPIENVETPRIETTPSAKEQIEGYLLALKSMVKEYNGWGNVSPIRLSFDGVEDRTRDRTVVTGKEIGDADLKRHFKEAVKTPLTRRIIEFAGPEFKMPTNIKQYDGTTDLEDHLS